MTKNDFLKKLAKKISSVEKNERLKYLSYYSEIIDDRIEECGSEENAFENLNIDEIAQTILTESKEKNILKKKQSPLMITLLILGSPLWLCLLAAAFAILLAFALIILAIMIVIFAVLFTVTISIWAVVITLIASGVFTLITLFTMMSVNPATAWALFGIGLVAQGIGILLFKPAIMVSVWFYKAYIFIWKKLIEGICAMVKSIKNRRAK